ncbi:MAG: PAS domain-containing protein [Roseicyclus sp.]
MASETRQVDALSSAILETVGLPLVSLGADLRVETVNDAFLRQFRVSREKSLGRLIYDLGNGQWDIPELRRLLTDLLPQCGTITDHRVDHAFEGIGRRIMHVNARRIVRTGTADMILLSITDDTEREMLRSELAGQMEFADKLIGSVREGLLILDPDLRVRSASGAFYAMFGTDPADTVGRLVHEVGNGQWDIPELRALLEDVLPRARSFDDFEVRPFLQGIGRRVMVLNGRRLDHMDLILLAIRDVTEARESEARLREVAQTGHVGLFDEDRRAGTLYWSPEFRDIVGYPRDADPPPSGTVPDFVHPEDRVAVADLLAQVAESDGEGAFFLEHRILRPGGGLRWVQMHGRAEREGRGRDRRLARVHGVLLDVTERRLASEAAREREARQMFLLGLADALRPLGSAGEIAATITRMIGEFLGATRAYWVAWPPGADHAEVAPDYAAPGLPSLAGRYPLDVFRPAHDRLAAGGVRIVADARRAADRARSDGGPHPDAGAVASVDVPLVRDGLLRAALRVVQDAPRHWTAKEVALIGEVAERCWAAAERRRAETALRDSEQRLRNAVAVARLGLWELDVATGTARWSDEVYAMHGIGIGAVEPSLTLVMNRLHPDDRDRIAAAMEAARARRTEFDEEYRVLRLDGSVRWLNSRGRFLYDSAGAPLRMLGAVLDTTARRQLEDRQATLIRELQHRTRNLIAVVQSLARDTMAASASPEDFRKAFEMRLGALARVQGLLSRSGEEPITLRELVRMELGALGLAAADDRARLDGPAVTLRPTIVQTLALAIHELATNALKHGALAWRSGRLHVRWSVGPRAEGGRALAFDWIETGVPADAAAPRKGFGRELIEQALPYALAAETSYDLGPDGVRCAIVLPLDRPPRRDRGPS